MVAGFEGFGGFAGGANKKNQRPVQTCQTLQTRARVVNSRIAIEYGRELSAIAARRPRYRTVLPVLRGASEQVLRVVGGRHRIAVGAGR